MADHPVTGLRLVSAHGLDVSADRGAPGSHDRPGGLSDRCVGPVLGADRASGPGRPDVGHAYRPADREMTGWSVVNGVGGIGLDSEQDINMAAVAAYRTSVDGGRPLSERRLAAMFGKISRRWARNRMAEARGMADAAVPGWNCLVRCSRCCVRWLQHCRKGLRSPWRRIRRCCPPARQRSCWVCRGRRWCGYWDQGISRSTSRDATVGSGSPTCWPTSNGPAVGTRRCWIKWWATLKRPVSTTYPARRRSSDCHPATSSGPGSPARVSRLPRHLCAVEAVLMRRVAQHR